MSFTGADVSCQYYGQYYNDETDNYFIEIFEDGATSNGKYILLDLLADYATCVDHSGTFTINSTYGINTARPGVIENGYLAGCWYTELSDGYISGAYAPMVEGTITVTLNADGTQTYTLDCVDDAGNKITGTVTGSTMTSALSKGAENQTKKNTMKIGKQKMHR